MCVTRGQGLDVVMPEVVKRLPAVMSKWTEPSPEPEAVAAAFTDLFTGIRRWGAP